MRILVTGSREFPDPERVDDTICDFIGGQDHPETEDWDHSEFVIVHGGCPTGADAQASAAVRRMSGDPAFPIREEVHPARWDLHGRAAGPKRNQEMVDLGADVCFAFLATGAGNRGTKDCASRALAAGIPVWWVSS